jgi:glutaredoxin/glutathione-dependent peroxiredoxin
MIKVGDRLPAGAFRVKKGEGDVKEVTVDSLFKGQKVIFVGVPGAFTTTCHYAHIPQFVANAATFMDNGIARIVVMAVNDAHVMKAWGEALEAEDKLDFVADGNADYAKALGLDVDLTASGLGTRVKRFSMLVDDGVVKTINFEPEGGKGIQTTGAATMLGQI